MAEEPAFDVGAAADDAFFYGAFGRGPFSSEQARRDRHVEYLRGYLQNVNARTLVVERQYTDGDYLDDFASYYVKCWQDYDRRCTRIHAFSVEFTREQFLAAVRTRGADTIVASLTDGYLGFIVVRPLPDAIVGRTVLATYPADNGRRNYTVRHEYHANLFGIELKVESLPYQEQDTVLAACATVALWSCFHQTAHLYGTRSPTPAAITRAANNIVRHTRPIPSRGLVLEQICGAIRHVELEPEVFAKPAEVPFASLIYAYLRARVPVILGVHIEGHGLHAVALTGYSLRPSPVRNSEGTSATSKVPFLGRRIDEFYAHDDGVGPFARIKIVDNGPDQALTLQGDWHVPGTGQLSVMTPDKIVVPVYHKIRLRFDNASEWVARLHYVIVAAGGLTADAIWDLHLADSNDVKRDLICGADDHRIESLLLLSHPRFVWHAELQYAGRVGVWMLADATDMERSCPVYTIVWRDEDLRNKVRRLVGARALQDQLAQWGAAFLAHVRASVGL